MATDGFPEGSFAHNVRKTCADRKLKTGAGSNWGNESEGIG